MMIKEIKNFHKLWSVWFFILIGIAPDLYNAVSSMGWLDEAPPFFVWTIRTLSVMGIISRLIKQEIKNELHDNLESNKE